MEVRGVKKVSGSKEEKMRLVGTVSRGIRGPIIREGDDLVRFVVDAVMAAHEAEGFPFHDRDVVCITEAIVGRAQGNYANIDQMAADIRKKFPEGDIGLFRPILSRNRFSLNLRGIARGAKKIYLQLTYPSDEVGNKLISWDQLDKKGVEPDRKVFTKEEFYETFGDLAHTFTGVDYIQFYQDIVEEEGCQVEILIANDPRELLNHTKNILTCDVHGRDRSKKLFKDHGAKRIYGLDDILTQSVDGSGYNEQFGLLGSNKATETEVKLFPRDCKPYVDEIQKELIEKTGKQIEVMIYGDGAFQDPVGHIWELADPVVSPAYTAGLSGRPNELKLKYLADNDFSNLRGEELAQAIKDRIRSKDEDLMGQMVSEGTTPRRITDILGSLADLTSGSGDKGTPIVLIQGYFDNLTSEEE